MAKRSPEMFRAYLDQLDRLGDTAKACRAVKVNRMTMHRWLAQSREAANGDQPSDLRFQYEGHEAWLHEHKREVERGIVSAVLGNALTRARDGVRQPALYQGRRVPKLDYDLMARGLPEHECYLRDPIDGTIEYEETYTPPSNELVLAVLGANLKKYSKRQTIDHQHNHKGGVLVAHQMPQQIERRPDLPMLEVIAEEIVDASEVLEPSSEEPEEIIAAEEIAAPEPIPPPRPMSDLQRDLIARAKEKGLPL